MNALRRFFLVLALLPVVAVSAEPVTMVTSPDKSISLNVQVDNDGRLTYAISRHGTSLIKPSRLGFLLTDALPLVRDMQIVDGNIASGHERWEQPWGERRYVNDDHTELLIQAQEKNGLHRLMNIRFRLFNDGVGFRYELPKQPNLTTARIAEELTEFDIASPGTAWWIPGGEWNRYEYLYNKTAIDAVATAHTPITMRLADGTHLSFHEAALVDYSSMWFKRAEGQRFRSQLSPSSSGPKVVRATPFATPWRTIRIADTAAGLYDNDLELNLNEPNKLGDVSWVKPYKFMGIWWGMFLNKFTWATGPKHGATTANAKAYIDFAAEHGIGSLLIEGWNKGWDGNWFGHGDEFRYSEPTPDYDLPAVAAYARRRGVHLVSHNETGGNIAVYEPQLEAAMALNEKLGICAVKTGYVADAGGIQAMGDDGKIHFEWHDGQVMSNHHLHVLEVAARHHIAIDAHEPIKDTGLRRTYPNWVAREGARGMEYNAGWGSNNPANHEPTLIFTRMLSGPMDFTPGILSLKGQGEAYLQSTLARQLALYVVLYSPAQMVADIPENLAKFPRELAFISQVPTDWSESHVLAGEVGEYAVLARKDRAGPDWYIGGVTDEHERDVSIALDFLDSNKTYNATIYRDGDGADYRSEKRYSIAIETRKLKKGDRMTLHLAAAGGMAVRLAAQ